MPVGVVYPLLWCPSQQPFHHRREKNGCGGGEALERPPPPVPASGKLGEREIIYVFAQQHNTKKKHRYTLYKISRSCGLESWRKQVLFRVCIRPRLGPEANQKKGDAVASG